MASSALKAIPLPAHTSKNLAEASLKVVRCYRKAMKSVPFIVKMYKLPDMKRSEMLGLVRNSFRQNTHVQDHRIVDMLRHRAELELQEALMGWKTYVQIMHFFKGIEPAWVNRNKGDSKFLFDFYRGQ
eukprot:TRINITY_DN1191_c0_g1_i1.p1 TRINITY_DN1191_c0_g1~~TRINITY_DN1191_c0_g1_i1.p1  ORF type:complete len:128 (-),score=42.10 TRINITY_DN1191_c0_g1_i1:37-420(-)